MRLSFALLACTLLDPVAGFSIHNPSTSASLRPITRQQQSFAFPLYSTASPEAPAASTANEEPTGVTVGDTKGAAMSIQNVAISRGSNRILQNVTFRVERGQRWGIVGPNGAGKSTLLGALTGTVRMDEGTALVAPKIDVGYLRQTAVSGSDKTVFEEASSEMTKINEAKARMEAAEEAIGNGDVSDETLNELDDATNDFTNAGGWTQEQTVANVLKGLGFLPEELDRLCSEFSGGWQMRIGLARLLLSKPSLLLLDEPSNHLDSSARNWLGSYLASFDGSLVLVSHDLALLEASVNNIAEVAGGTVLTYVSCNYERYLEEKEFRAKSAMAEYERNMAEAARLQAYVDKWGASATKATSAQSRVKMIEKMRKEGKLTPPAGAVVEKRGKPSLVLPKPPKSMGEILLSLEDADVGYPGEVPLIENVNFELKRGQKLILRGPNGAGKSTLMAALRGTLELQNGKRKENEQLRYVFYLHYCVIRFYHPNLYLILLFLGHIQRLGYFTQDLAQQLDPNARAVDLVTAYAREGEHGDITVSDEDARGVMGRLGLSADKPLRKISELSGGEKARVALSMFALKASNVYMLDEPSNHLDVEW
jgi:ATP-binding cassette subfamily F protein 3